MKKIGFDNAKYLKMQSENIRKRINQFGGKLYLEFGGKIFDDCHASRVLPGFAVDAKLQLLLELKEQVEMIIVINSDDIENNKIRADLGITYDLDVLRLIDAYRSKGLYIGSVVLSRFNSQPLAIKFENQLKSFGIAVYHHYTIPGYPSDVDYVISDEGYGRNDYIKTTKELVVVTAPGPGSGKMATCLSQLYHDYKNGIKSGYAKFETFPIWNLPLKHPVNLAYEAATTDLNDVNMIDPFHLEAYNEAVVNYNRDIDIFPVLKSMFIKIYGSSPYKSPTDMGVNMAGYCIFDNEVVSHAAEQEIIRRYFHALCQHKLGLCSNTIVSKNELLLKSADVNISDRPVVEAAIRKFEQDHSSAIAIELYDGKIITGKSSEMLSATSAMLLNSLKYLSNIPDDLPIISENVLKPIIDLKMSHFGSKRPKLRADEILLALSITATTSPVAKRALDHLEELRFCEAHSSKILSASDEKILKRLNVNLTCSPNLRDENKIFHD